MMNLVVASSMSVNVLGIGLIVLGLVLLMVTLAFWRGAVDDPDVLAPLEVMADRSFAKADETKRLALLNQVRPDGAEPVVHHAAPTVLIREPASEPVRPFRDPYDHADDAVDVLPQSASIIDPLLNQTHEEQ
jgi:hypothetical protein